jgi:hypothetical protein
MYRRRINRVEPGYAAGEEWTTDKFGGIITFDCIKKKKMHKYKKCKLRPMTESGKLDVTRQQLRAGCPSSRYRRDTCLFDQYQSLHFHIPPTP